LLANKSFGDQAERAPELDEEILRIADLSVEFRSGAAHTQAVRGLSLSLHAGRVLGVAGESGSGKTTAALAAMGLLARPAVATGSVSYRGKELLGLKERQLRLHRGQHLAMIFQETATALNPVMKIGDQLMMAARAHVRGGKSESLGRVTAALEEVRLVDTRRVMASYPHELSGGMCQRVMIAMALTCGSNVLFADEPTTALDVSVQEEILELLRGIVERRRLAVMMISHDLAVLGDVCDRIVVMYQGEAVETGEVKTVLANPAHPYTQALLACVPTLHGGHRQLPEMKPVTRTPFIAGCRFRPRCSWATEVCEQAPELSPVTDRPGRGEARCWHSSAVLQKWPSGTNGRSAAQDVSPPEQTAQRD
jgi:oligopeptide/dipeptide ABC transporter ATP-binding protein